METKVSTVLLLEDVTLSVLPMQLANIVLAKTLVWIFL